MLSELERGVAADAGEHAAEGGGGEGGERPADTRPIGHHKFNEQFMHTEGAAAAPQAAPTPLPPVLTGHVSFLLPY